MKRSVLNIILFYLVLGLPLWMFLTWLFWPKTKLVIAIVDKTVLFKSGQEHASLNWVLRNNKYAKNSQELYKVGRDYFGFFPNKDKKYDLKGLERASDEDLEMLSVHSDMTYVTDTYGILLQRVVFGQKHHRKTTFTLWWAISARHVFP